MFKICLDALKKAKEKDIIVSIDLNYRSKLWTKEQARVILGCLLPYVDYCKDLFWFLDETADIQQTAERMIKDFELKGVAVTSRNSKSASEHSLSGAFFVEGKSYFSKEYSMHLVDRIGGGDAFSAGMIYALMNGYKGQETIDFAVATSCLKHSIELDFNLVTKEEVETLLTGNGNGRVQR